MSDARTYACPEAVRWQLPALAVGCAAFAACGIGAIFDLDRFLHAYLMAWTAWLGIALGSLAVRMLHNLTGGQWGLLVRPFLTAATRTLPLLLAASLPLAFQLDRLYSWAGSGEEAAAVAASFKHQYLNVPFFLTRGAFYFAAWLALAYVMDHPVGMQSFSGPGLVIYGLTVTFASIDWIMSLDPAWYSSIFGVLVAAGELLPGLGLALAMSCWLAPGSPLERWASADVWNDLGNLLLAFVMLWTYMMFSQLLLIWCGNLPEEITFYLPRCEGGWQWLSASLALFYFAFPFGLLLSRGLKRRPQQLRWVALAVVVMSFVQQFWLIAPAYRPFALEVHWLDPLAVIGLGGLWFAYFLWQLGRVPWVPSASELEPRLQEEPQHA